MKKKCFPIFNKHFYMCSVIITTTIVVIVRRTRFFFLHKFYQSPILFSMVNVRPSPAALRFEALFTMKTLTQWRRSRRAQAINGNYKNVYFHVQVSRQLLNNINQEWTGWWENFTVGRSICSLRSRIEFDGISCILINLIFNRILLSNNVNKHYLITKFCYKKKKNGDDTYDVLNCIYYSPLIISYKNVR